MDFSNDTIDRHPIKTSEFISLVNTLRKDAGSKVRLLEEQEVPMGRSTMRQHHETSVFRNPPFSDWCRISISRRTLPNRSLRLAWL